MFEITYIYAVILSCLYVYRILSTDPERDKIWGTKSTQSQLKDKEKEIKLLKTQLDHYKNYRSVFADAPPQEEYSHQ